MTHIPRKKDQVVRWNRILREKPYSPEEPDEFVTSFAESLGKAKTLRVLDLGCGAGRHLVYFESHGLKACGVDFAQTGLGVAKKRLRGQGLDALLVRGDIKTLPFVDSCFDIVVSTRVIYHQRLEEIRDTILEIRRVLERRGLLLIDLLSTRTHKYGKGARLEENTFVEQEGLENDVIHHFSDKQEIQRLFANFKILGLELREWEIEGKIRSRWVVTAQRQNRLRELNLHEDHSKWKSH